MVSTQDGYTVLGRHSSNISEWISVHIGTYCIRMDNRNNELNQWKKVPASKIQ